MGSDEDTVMSQLVSIKQGTAVQRSDWKTMSADTRGINADRCTLLERRAVVGGRGSGRWHDQKTPEVPDWTSLCHSQTPLTQSLQPERYRHALIGGGLDGGNHSKSGGLSPTQFIDPCG